MNKAILAEYYAALTAGGELERFVQRVNERYNEGTLGRLLQSADAMTREAAVVALRYLGTMASNAAVAACLRDRQARLRELAEGTLWTLWFRADSEKNTKELQRFARLIGKEDYPAALAGLNKLIRRSPHFAEAYNQRAILHWRRGQHRKAIDDCKRVIAMNPFHFGAQAGMGQCYLQMQRSELALQEFRAA